MNETTDKKTRRQIRKWRRIIRHEWYNCRHREDRYYMSCLFVCVENQPVDWPVTGVLISIGALYGAMVGVLSGIIAENWNITSSSDWHVAWTSYPSHAIWGLTSGAFIGLLAGLCVRRALTWERWLGVFPGDGSCDSRSEYLLSGVFFGIMFGAVPAGVAYIILKILTGDPILKEWSEFLSYVIIGLVFSAGYGLGMYLGWGLVGGFLGTLCTGLLVWIVSPMPIGLAFILGGTLGILLIMIHRVATGTGRDQRTDPPSLGVLFCRPFRPSLFELEEALRGIGGVDFAEPLQQIDAWRENMTQIEPLLRLFYGLCYTDVDDRKGDNRGWWQDGWGLRFAACHTLVYAGGEAVAGWRPLVRERVDSVGMERGCLRFENVRQYTALERRLILGISHETSERLGHKAPHLLCPDCLARCVAHKVHVSWWRRVRVYGCRVCWQSRTFIECPTPVVAALDTWGRPILSRQGRHPLYTEFEEAIKPIDTRDTTEINRHLSAIQNSNYSPEMLSTCHDSSDWRVRIAFCLALVRWGGEAVAKIRQTTEWDQDTRAWLLRSIAQETSGRLSHQAHRLLCPHCVARCIAHKVRLSQRKHTWLYGCRVCRQSREFIEHAGEVVAVLDTHWNEERRQTDGILGVNWHKRRAVFDFDKVQILQATDEDVERFCVQVANDSDTYRRKRYRTIPVTIASSCTLSENSLRILRSTFRHVEGRS